MAELCGDYDACEHMPVDRIFIPNSLRKAQQRNELVLFLGAGVSYAEPANCPRLVDVLRSAWDEFAPELSKPFKELEEPERKMPYLFDHLVKNRGDDVKQFVQSAYAGPVKPSKLHEHVVRLFRRDQALKIVTTNYDTLISKAAEGYRGARPGEYVYPDLSLSIDNRPIRNSLNEGDNAHPNPHPRLNLSGIAYIHGTVGCDPSHIVLGDRDFDKAYLGRNDAARGFLSNIFESEHVLFIGYSADDPIVGRAVRALCDKDRTHVFTHKDRGAQWSDVEVSVHSYASSEVGGKHDVLVNTLKDWGAGIQRLGVTDESTVEASND